MRRCGHTCGSLGDSTAHLEGHGGREGGGQATKKKTQQLLDFASVTGPREFMRVRTLEAVTKLIATNNQVQF